MLYRGEAENTAFQGMKALREQGNLSHWAFKFDFRLVFIHAQKQNNVANCEFAKNGDLKRMVVIDNVKVMVEAKCMYLGSYRPHMRPRAKVYIASHPYENNQGVLKIFACTVIIFDCTTALRAIYIMHGSKLTRSFSTMSLIHTSE